MKAQTLAARITAKLTTKGGTKADRPLFHVKNPMP